MTMHFLQIAKKLAHDAGKMALHYQEKGFRTETKGAFNNLVTEADHAVEKLIVETIRKNFPDHSILTEESDPIQGTSEYKWIIDPIDGTTNFAHGHPMFCVSIALIENGKPILGVVEMPTLNETFWARSGDGAYRNRHRISVSQKSDFKECLLAIGVPYDRGSERAEKSYKMLRGLYEQSRGVRRTGSAVMDLCFVACGRYDGYLEYGLKPWDIAAGKVIVEEAGGMVTNMDGSILNPKEENLLASNGLMHQPLMDFIRAQS